MSLYGLSVFCLVYALAVAAPGPGVAAVVARSLARGSSGAPAFIAGFVIGDLVWFTLAATGLAALFFLALLPTVVKLETLTVAGYFEIAAVICVVPPMALGSYVIAAVRARKLLRSPRALRLVNRGGATAMAGAAVAVAAN